jgi:hypothetical protein
MLRVPSVFRPVVCQEVLPIDEHEGRILEAIGKNRVSIGQHHRRMLPDCRDDVVTTTFLRTDGQMDKDE